MDTYFTVKSDIAGPGTSNADRVSISQPMPVGGGAYETIVTFGRLFESDSGSYNCSARLASSQDNVIISDPTSAVESIDVARKLKLYQVMLLMLSTFVTQNVIFYSSPASRGVSLT